MCLPRIWGTRRNIISSCLNIYPRSTTRSNKVILSRVMSLKKKSYYTWVVGVETMCCLLCGHHPRSFFFKLLVWKDSFRSITGTIKFRNRMVFLIVLMSNYSLRTLYHSYCNNPTDLLWRRRSPWPEYCYLFSNNKLSWLLWHTYNMALKGALAQWLAPLPFTPELGVRFPVSAGWKKQKMFLPHPRVKAYRWPKARFILFHFQLQGLTNLTCC